MPVRAGCYQTLKRASLLPLPFAYALAVAFGPIADPETECRGPVGHTAEAPQPGPQSAQVSASRVGQGAAVVEQRAALFCCSGRLCRCAALHPFVGFLL